jgi:hypothetical protein
VGSTGVEGGRNPAEPDDSTATGSAVVSVAAVCSGAVGAKDSDDSTAGEISSAGFALIFLVGTLAIFDN